MGRFSPNVRNVGMPNKLDSATLSMNERQKKQILFIFVYEMPLKYKEVLWRNSLKQITRRTICQFHISWTSVWLLLSKESRVRKRRVWGSAKTATMWSVSQGEYYGQTCNYLGVMGANLGLPGNTFRVMQGNLGLPKKYLEVMWANLGPPGNTWE